MTEPFKESVIKFGEALIPDSSFEPEKCGSLSG